MAIELDLQAGPRTAQARSKPLLKMDLRIGAPRVSSAQRMFFTERLALMLQTGTPLYQSLDVLATQVDNRALREVIERLRDDIAGGVPFSQALAKHPEIFSSTYVSLVGAAEQGGFLAEVLEQLMSMQEKAARLRATIVSSFTYPAFLMTFSLAVVVFVLTVVFPKFAEMFAVIRDQLPLSTLVLMSISDFLRQHWLAVLGGGGALIGGFGYWLITPSGSAAVDGLKLRVPGVRDLFIQLYMTQSMWVLGLSLGHGVSVPDALKACRDVVHNTRFRAFMTSVEAEVQEGRGMTPAFESSDLVPSLAKQLIATGEQTGNLAIVMNRLADFYERELGRKLQTFAKLVEPVMLLVMGVVVGLLVASLILPIFKLSKAVR